LRVVGLSSTWSEWWTYEGISGKQYFKFTVKDRFNVGTSLEDYSVLCGHYGGSRINL